MTERQRRFCEEYLIDLCAAKAAQRAGYSPRTAGHHAAGWIKPERPLKPELRAEIDRLLAERALRTRVSADRVIEELADIAFAGDAAPESGEADSAATGRRAADGVRTQDRLRALELLGKHLGMFGGEARAERGAPVIIDDVEEARDGRKS